jgi:hypothetical protein
VIPSRILLTDGKPRAWPTDDTTSVRFRVPDKADAVGKPAAGEILLALEVSLEPRLQWQQLVDVKVGKATDDQGQKLEQVAHTERPAIGLGGPGGFPVAPPAGGGGAGGAPGAPAAGAWRKVGAGGVAGFATGEMDLRSRLAAVRLKAGTKASTALKELTGTVTARVLTESKTLLTVTDVFKSTGKTVKGAEGGSILLIAATREGSRHGLRLEVELPGGAPTVASSAGDRVILGRRTSDTAQYELTLVDENDNLLQVAGLGMTTGKRIEFSLAYLSRPGQGAPAKLALRERKQVSVELPFTLKDVPLP